MNEVKLLNIGGIDQNVKDQYARDIIAPSENGLDSTSNLPVASRHYDAGEFLIGQDRLYYEALVEINVGDTLVVNSNIKATTVSEELVSLRNKSADAAIECIAPIESTGLSTAEYAVGEYLYWDYGLNAGLYKAKVAINIGDALIVDTNIEAADPITKSLAGIDGLREEFTQINNNLGAKNLLDVGADNKTMNGITFTINEDGSVVANGTATDDAYIYLSKSSSVYDMPIIGTGCPTDNQNNSLFIGFASGYTDVGNGVNIPANVAVSPFVYIKSGTTVNNVVFKPMLRPAYITDDTYEPYARSNQELTGEVEPMLNILGAKNLLPNNATSQVVFGVTYTVNADGSVTANGTTPSQASANIDIGSVTLPVGKYILSGCPSGGSLSTYFITIQGAQMYEIGDGLLFNVATPTTYTIKISVQNGVTVSNLVFKPMIRPASIKDNTYVPYAMTNRELTNIAHKSKVIHYPIENISVSTAWGAIFYRNLAIPISVSGTIKGALVSFVSVNGQAAVVSLASITNSTATLLFVRGETSSGLTGTVTLEVFYE